MEQRGLVDVGDGKGVWFHDIYLPKSKTVVTSEKQMTLYKSISVIIMTLSRYRKRDLIVRRDSIGKIDVKPLSIDVG